MQAETNAAQAAQAPLKRCPTCGDLIEREIDLPLFDGSGKTFKRTVHVMCSCEKEKQEAFSRRMQLEAEQRKVANLRRLSLLDDNKECSNARFSTYEVDQDNQRQFNIAQRYVQHFAEMLEQRQGLLFWGTVGTGKSYTAAAIANELLDRTVSVVMTSFVKLIDELQRQTFSDSEQPYLDRLNQTKLLIIDDLGAERGTDYALEKVYDIVDSRYRDGKPVIFTTNLTMQQMKESSDIRYTRIYDRIFEMCYPVKFSGLSRRKRKAAERYATTKKILEGE